jgi:hypothetical protein
MKAEKFDLIFEATLRHLEELKDRKAKDYASREDRFHNFKVAAQLQGTTPLAALKGFMSKQEVCILDMIYAVDIYDETFVNRNIDDVILYLILLKGLIKERNKALQQRNAQQAETALSRETKSEPKLNLSR